jgi:deleted-in-malignant-brain-tumors protein 1
VPSVAASGSFQWSSNVSRRINLDLAVEEAVAGALSREAAGWDPQLAIVFLSSAYVAEYDQLVELLRQKVPSLKHIFGSTVGAADFK